ncbi:uncharacterized protein LOC130747537 [Lotus japonicus]|uniref:uncharacterized protein LOC130747537 n=1 Tax=Lotus japonicus TaxID=34305 RepID=UPI00258F733A|nr:uncharacterized protein LOC130747537 [Lotus japonicus]
MDVTKDEAATAEAEGGGADQPPNPISNSNPNPNPLNTTRGSKGKSCTGCTYYSSLRKAKSKNPTCIGLSRTRQAPPAVGKIELKAYREGLSLANFKYACIGYSVYLDKKDSSADLQDKTSKLPYCVGIEAVFNQRPSTSTVGHAPAPVHKAEEHNHVTPQPPSYKPPIPNITGEEFLNRFQRNASLVAAGVAKNLNRVGHYVKETLGDMLNRRSK